ncbi:MAG: hypothetical protein ACP5PV_05955 [Methanothrix sp.]
MKNIIAIAMLASLIAVLGSASAYTTDDNSEISAQIGYAGSIEATDVATWALVIGQKDLPANQNTITLTCLANHGFTVSAEGLAGAHKGYLVDAAANVLSEPLYIKNTLDVWGALTGPVTVRSSPTKQGATLPSGMPDPNRFSTHTIGQRVIYLDEPSDTYNMQIVFTLTV